MEKESISRDGLIKENAELRARLSLARQALADRESCNGEHALLRLVMESTHAQLAYLDQDFKFILVNKAYVAGCGKTEVELLGRVLKRGFQEVLSCLCGDCLMEGPRYGATLRLAR